MLLQDKTAREIEQACAAVLFDPVEWTELANRFPGPGEHVMLKMDDGIVEVSCWNPAKSGWSNSPFESSGRPVAWAPVPLLFQQLTWPLGRFCGVGRHRGTFPFPGQWRPAFGPDRDSAIQVINF